jgi:hypothetical protein
VISIRAFLTNSSTGARLGLPVVLVTLTLRTGATQKNLRYRQPDRFLRQRRQFLAAHRFLQPKETPEHPEQALRGCCGIDPLELPRLIQVTAGQKAAADVAGHPPLLMRPTQLIFTS